PLKPELRFVILRLFPVINAVNVEFPASAAVERGLDRNAVANLPVKALRRLRSNNGPLAILQEICPLVLGNDQLGKNLPLVFRIDDELRKEVSFVLVDTAEPVVVSDRLHALNAQNLVAIGKWNQIDDRGAVDGDKTI